MPTERVQKFRRERLLAASETVGGKAALGRLLGYKDGAFVGQMLRAERPITEDTVLKLEAKPGFKGWFSGAPADKAPEQDQAILEEIREMELVPSLARRLDKLRAELAEFRMAARHLAPKQAQGQSPKRESLLNPGKTVDKQKSRGNE